MLAERVADIVVRRLSELFHERATIGAAASPRVEKPEAQKTCDIIANAFMVRTEGSVSERLSGELSSSEQRERIQGIADALLIRARAKTKLSRSSPRSGRKSKAVRSAKP